MCFSGYGEGAADRNTRSHKTVSQLYFSCSLDEQKRRGLRPVVISSGLAFT